MKALTLAQIAKHAAETTGDLCFIHQVSSGEEISYARVWETSYRLYELLALRPGSRVVLIAANHWIFFPLLIACSMRGLILVPLDPNLHPDELKRVLEHCAPDLLVYNAGQSDQRAPLGRTGADTLSVAELLARASRAPRTPTAEGAETSKKERGLLLIYTSGTTGGQKAVLLTEGNLLADAASLRDFYGIRDTDRFFCVLPTFHMNAILITGILPLIAGARIVLSDVFGFKNAKFFWQDLEKYRISICSLVPSIMALLLKLRRPEAAPASLRHAFCGAAPLSAELWREFEQAFGVPVYQGYGLTETTCWAAATPPTDRNHETVGLPLPGCEIRIDAQDGAEGEILIRGPIVMNRYYRDRALTERHFTPDRFYRTGDLGRIGADGLVRVTGRLKEIIIRNGVNVAGRDIDAILMENPAIQEAKTIGLPDPLVGERVHCVCTLKADAGREATPEALLAWLRPKLSEYKRPDQLWVMGYLPKTSTGKIAIGRVRKILDGTLRDEIVAALGNCHRKRAQPSDPAAIRARVQAALLRGEPIPFVTYWGCGPRASVIAEDRHALDRLAELAVAATRAPETPARISLIFTDVHAFNNGIPAERYGAYFSEIRKYAESRGMNFVTLSEIWKNRGLDPQALAAASTEPEFTKGWLELPIRAKLVEQARKHFEAGDDFEGAAKRYYRACLWDREILSERFAGSIFLTFNSPEMDALLPELPRAYLYSFREGVSTKPWFVEKSEESREAA